MRLFPSIPRLAALLPVLLSSILPATSFAQTSELVVEMANSRRMSGTETATPADSAYVNGTTSLNTANVGYNGNSQFRTLVLIDVASYLTQIGSATAISLTLDPSWTNAGGTQPDWTVDFLGVTSELANLTDDWNRPRYQWGDTPGTNLGNLPVSTSFDPVNLDATAAVQGSGADASNRYLVFRISSLTPPDLENNYAGGLSTSTADNYLTITYPTASNFAPTATSLAISGTPAVGIPLLGSYTYADAESDPEGSSVLQWYRSDDATFGGDTLVGSGAFYTPTLADEGKYLFFEVQPIAQTGETAGSAVQSNPTIPILPIVFSENSNGAVTLFFVGGQSNATSAFRDGIQQRLREADRWDNPLVVHAYHPGQQISTWFDGTPGVHYEADFKHGSGTGVLETKIAELEAAGNRVTIGGFFWFQGESDTGSDELVNAYVSRFNGMLSQLATDLNDGTPIPFAITLITGDSAYEPLLDNPVRIAQVAALAEVQRSIAESSSIGVWVDSAAYPREDAWHLTEADRTLFGADLAEAFLANLDEPVVTSLAINATAIRALGSDRETYSSNTTSSGKIAVGWANTHSSEQIWKTMLAFDLGDAPTRASILAQDRILLEIDDLPALPDVGGPFRLVYAGQSDTIPVDGANWPVNNLWAYSVAPRMLGVLNAGTVGASFDVTSLLKGLDYSTNPILYFRIETAHPGPNASLSGSTSVFQQPAADAIQLVGSTPVLPKKILPLGDSITNGTRGSFVGSGYRYYLENFMIAYGYQPSVDYQMVGSKRNGYRTDPDTGSGEQMKQRLNSGRGGWTIDKTLTGGDLYGTLEPSLADLMADQEPDIVMLMLGTNDVGYTVTTEITQLELDSLKTDYRNLLDTLLAQNPQVQVIMAKIPPVASTSATPAAVNALRIEPYNNKVVQVIFDEYASVHPGWKLIDNYSVLDATMPTDDFDAATDFVHPIDRGHERMARNWFAALVSLLEGDAVALTGVTEPFGQDALLRGGADAATALNNGSDWATRGIRISGDATNPEKALLRFEVSDLPATTGSVALGLTWVGASTANADSGAIASTIEVYAVADGNDGWDEATVTWNSAPGNDSSSPSAAAGGSTTYLGAISVHADITAGDTIALRSSALTDFINNARGADGLVTLLLTSPHGTYSSWLGDVSNANYHPAFLIAGEGRARPGALSGQALSESAIRLRWNDWNADETGYTLQRRALGSAEWLTVSNAIPADATAYLDSALSVGSYEYRLRADGTAAGASDWSNPVTLSAQRVDPPTRVYEPFDYADERITTGSFAQNNGGIGFSGKWSSTGSPELAAAFEPGSLSVASNPFITEGGAAGAGSIGNTASRALLAHNAIDLDADGVVYFSFLYRPGSLNFNHLEFTGTADPITVGNRVRTSDNAPLWRAVAGSGTQGTSETPAITLSQAYFIAGRLVTTAAGNDQLQFSAYGTADSVPASEPGSFNVNSAPAALTGSITGISLTGGGSEGVTGFDEIRIGDSWTAVTAPAAYQSFATWASGQGMPAATVGSDLNANGVADGVEYATGVGAGNPTLQRLPQLVLASDGANDYLGLDVHLAPGALDFGLRVEESDDLQTWRTIWQASDADALNHPLLLGVESQGASQTLWIRASRPIRSDVEGDRGFLRIGLDASGY